jgi:FkbM family methyltransferase
VAATHDRSEPPRANDPTHTKGDQHRDTGFKVMKASTLTPWAIGRIRGLLKPEYLFTPRQLLLRMVSFYKSAGPGFEVLELPWKLPLEVKPTETLGFAIWRFGVYDLAVSEVLWRLTDPGDWAADVGANVGYMTSILAVRVGSRGKVTAFEPHPTIFEQLQRHVSQWAKRADLGQVELIRCALSNERGETELLIPDHFVHNPMLAFIKNSLNDSKIASSIPVLVTTLDEAFRDHECPSLIKVDTEGNECSVFEGGHGLLSRKAIRDILFEDHGEYPTAAMSLLERHGYSLFRIRKRLLGPSLTDPQWRRETDLWEPPSYLATADPGRAIARLSSRGWRVLNP